MTCMKMLCVVVLLAAVVAAGEVSSDVTKRTKELIALLGSDDFDVRTKSVELFRELPAEALPLIENAIAEANSDPDLALLLKKACAIVQVKARRNMRGQIDRDFLAWNRKTLIEAYQAHALKNEKWDSDARDALERISVAWTKRVNVPIADFAAIYAVAQRAIAAGCDDPLVLYVRARTYESQAKIDHKTHNEWHEDAAKKMLEMPYHSMRKAFACARAAESLTRFEKPLTEATKLRAMNYLDLALKHLSEGLLDKSVAAVMKRDHWNTFVSTHLLLDPDRKNGIDKIFAAMTRDNAQDATPLILKAESYTNYAWDARGGGYANTVTPEGWRLMKERLVVAEELLERAWKMDPTQPDAAIAMLGVELGQSKGRERMELWFARAMQADPDCMAACEKKLYYLEPKWHGSEEDMVQFGRELLRGGNFETRLPSILVDAHFRAAGYLGDASEQYFKNPAVWSDIKAVYDGLLRVSPDSAWDRSWLARSAVLCEQWDAAHEQFQRLGKNVSVGAFKNAQQMEQMRAQAAGMAGRK